MCATPFLLFLICGLAATGAVATVLAIVALVFALSGCVVVTKQFANSPPWARRGYDITPSGEFVGLIAVGQTVGAAAATPQILFVLNWA
jgi:hypothetical protein